MPSNRSIRSGARAVRDSVTRAHRRADRFPRLPFGVAIVLAAVALLVAVEHRPESDEETVAVEELPSGPPTFYEGEFFGEPVEVDPETIEYGFSKVTDADGEEWLLAAVVIRNSHDRELSLGGISVRGETEEDYPLTLEDLYLGSIPPVSTAAIGYVVYADAEDVEVEDLELDVLEPSTLFPDGKAPNGVYYSTDPLPEVEVIGLEPLTSPDGYRVHFRIESAAVANVRLSVLFRDGEGRLLGGFPTVGDPFSFEGGYAGARTLPEGESFQHFDVLESWIPEGADLDRIEIGPSR